MNGRPDGFRLLLLVKKLADGGWTPAANGHKASNLPIATVVTHRHLAVQFATASPVFSLSEEEHGRVACFTKQDALPSALEKLDVLLRQMQGYAVLLGAERSGSRDAFPAARRVGTI